MKAIDPINLCDEFALRIVGESNEPIYSPGSLKNCSRNSILWVKNADNLKKIEEGYVLINEKHVPSELNPRITLLVTDKPTRLMFSKIIIKYFNYDEDESFINDVEFHKKNPNIRIGENVFIGKDVTIGDGTIIHHNVVIHSKTYIGKNCLIKTHVSLGTEGLGLDLDPESGALIKFPQLGGVIFEDNVEIGPTSTVRRSALDDTIIKKGTKIGALCNIGHNSIIGENCILTCQIVTSGSSIIGDNVFMGVNSIIKNGINVGSNVTIGLGAIVTKDVPNGTTCIGNPAEDINEYKTWSKLKKKLTEMFGKDL